MVSVRGVLFIGNVLFDFDANYHRPTSNRAIGDTGIHATGEQDYFDALAGPRGVMRAKLFLCAQSSSLDARTNAISVFHVLEELHAPAYPVALPAMSIIAFLELEEGEPIDSEVQLQILLGEQQLFVGPFQTNFQVRRKARALADFNGLVIPAPGVLRVLLTSAERNVAAWEMTCDQVLPPHLQMHLPQQEQPPEHH